MKANKKILILLGTAVAFMLAVGATYAFLFFITKDKTEATALLSEKIDELSGREARIASSLLALRNQSANVDKISAYFFKESEVVSFAKKIEALGAESRTTLTIESLDQGYTEKTVPFLNFRIKATGKFSDVQSLLMLLENFPGKLEWKTIQLVRLDLPPDSAQVSTSSPKVAVSKGSLWRADVFLVALNFTNQ